MVFTSCTYILFLLMAAIAYRYATLRGREHLLLWASLVFYAAWDARFLAVLIGLGAFTYAAGRMLAKSSGRVTLLGWSVAAILLVLAVFKYGAWATGAVNLLLPGSWRLTLPDIILPLGISFYTFECISYLLDVYKGAPEIRPFRRFLLFPAFWPHMVAGPILRIKEFAPQLDALRTPRAAEMLAGIDRILIGLCKKVVLANAIAAVVDRGFAGGAVTNSALDNWVLAFAFGLQIYLDFSAYTDIAIGSARLLGFTFPENFNLPYHAANPTEFWNRWHMTLSRWIRDYLFFPLNLRAGRRTWLRYLNLVAVMALVGLWHGAGLTFVCWGAWHGLLMVGHRFLEKPLRRLPAWTDRPVAAAGCVLTAVLVNAAWILFRSPDLAQAARMLKSMVTLAGWTPALSANDYLLVLFCLTEYALLEVAVRNFVNRDPLRVTYAGPSFWLRPVAYTLAVALLFAFDTSNVAFIYFQF